MYCTGEQGGEVLESGCASRTYFPFELSCRQGDPLVMPLTLGFFFLESRLGLWSMEWRTEESITRVVVSLVHFLIFLRLAVPTNTASRE